MRTLTVTNDAGIAFNAVYLAPGETAAYPAAAAPDRAQVEFYDTRYPFTEWGQFTGGRYRVDTILSGPPGAGISVDGREPDWTIQGPQMDAVRAFLWECVLDTLVEVVKADLDARGVPVDRVDSDADFATISILTGATWEAIEIDLAPGAPTAWVGRRAWDRTGGLAFEQGTDAAVGRAAACAQRILASRTAELDRIEAELAGAPDD